MAIQQAALALLALPDGTAPDRLHHAAGIGHLALGDVDDGIASLERAADLAPNNAEVRSDLAAALLERWRRDQTAIDAQGALNAARAAARLLPTLAAASFNLAKAAEAVGSKQAALEAWQAYLKLDSTSPWATEAKDEIARLEREIGNVSKGDISFLLEDVIEPWAKAQTAGTYFDASAGRRVVTRLRSDGRNQYLVDLFGAIEHSGTMSPARRVCLVNGINSMRESRTSFDGSRYVQAQELAERAKAAFDCAGTSNIDAVVQSAWCLAFSDNRPRALSLLKSLSVDANRRGYVWQLGRAQYIRGLSAVGNGLLAVGLQDFADAIVLFARAGDQAQVAAARVQRADTLMSSGDPDAAWTELREALAGLHAIQRPRLRYMVLSMASLFSLDGNQADAASVYMQLLEGVVNEWNQPVVAVDAAVRRATLYAGLGRAEEARAAIATGRSALSRIDDQILRSQYDAAFGWTETRLALDHHEAVPEEVMAAAMARIEKANMTYALAEAYLLRGNSHEVRGNTADAIADWNRSIGALEAHRARVGSHDLSVSRTSALWDAYARLIVASLSNGRESLQIAERSRGQELIGVLNANDRSLEAPAQPFLPKGVVGLAYVTLQDKLIVWRIVDDVVDVVVQPIPLATLQNTINDWRSGDSSAGATLAAWLLPAGLPSGDSVNIAIVPDGPLHEVSFAALRDPASGRFLVEDRVPVVVPSLAVYRRLSAYPARAVGKAVIAGSGAAQPALGLAALPQVSPEVTRIAAIYATQPQLGERATRQALLGQLRSAAVFHFAGHAVADARRPQNSRLFVNGDDTGDSISAADISPSTFPRGALVILSACNGARGKPYRGEGAMNLARPFLAGGAAAVLASLAPVPDREASQFVADVHQHLVQGASLESSVAMAQRTAIRAQWPVNRWMHWSVVGTTGRSVADPATGQHKGSFD